MSASASAFELAADDIRDAPFAAQSFVSGRDPDAVREGARNQIPAKRFGDPAEFGAACAFLCGAQAGFITGQNVLLDGGQFPGLL